MLLIITVVLSFLMLVGLFLLLYLIKRPVYRLDKNNLICLFEMLLADQASEDDWNVFIEMPIRYDDYLESIRCHCIELTDSDIQLVSGKARLSDIGRQDIEQLLLELKQLEK